MYYAFKKTECNLLLKDIFNRITQEEILTYYLGIDIDLPVLINSPLRIDNNPSFSIYKSENGNIRYIDFATGDRGNLLQLLCLLYNKNYKEILSQIEKDLINNTFKRISSVKTSKRNYNYNKGEIKVKIRGFNQKDIDYWNSYGIGIKLLKKAHVFPIEYIFVYKNDREYTLKADELAYTFIENKDNHLSYKVYQPYNKYNLKWLSNTDKSVISLWTLLPNQGDKIYICSSLKDSLCLKENIGVDTIALQGEGYSISNSIIKELKNRFKKIYIIFDSDEAGIKNSIRLSKETGFQSVFIPNSLGKDISDIYKKINNKDNFINYLNFFIND